MKAVRFHGQKDIRLEEVEEPKCGRGQVKVRGKVPSYFDRHMLYWQSLHCDMVFAQSAHFFRLVIDRSNLHSAVSVAQIFMNTSVEQI